MRFAFDDQRVDYVEGDSVADAIVRSGEHPAHGGALCLAGDCGNCSADIDGVPFTRTCLTPARPGLRVRRHPAVGGPALELGAPKNPVQSPAQQQIDVQRRHVDVAVVGGGRSGSATAAEARATGREVLVLDAGTADEVVGVYPGPMVVVRRPEGMLHVHAHEVVIATGAAEVHPVCPGNMLRGIVTADAAAHLLERGVSLGATVTVDLSELASFEGTDGWVTLRRKDTSGREKKAAGRMQSQPEEWHGKPCITSHGKGARAQLVSQLIYSTKGDLAQGQWIGPGYQNYKAYKGQGKGQGSPSIGRSHARPRVWA